MRHHKFDTLLGATLSNKSLRILIADEQHFQRMRIERLFNQLNYYRIAPVQDLAELLNLVDYGCDPFDLVVINAQLAAGMLDLPDFFVDNRHVHHAFIYNSPQVQLPTVVVGAQQTVQMSHAALPDLASIQRLMSKVDARLPSVGTVISVR